MTELSTEQLSEKIRAMEAGNVDKPTLAYFDILGIVWPIRCLLNMLEVDFEDVRVPLPAWAHRTETGDRPLKNSLTSFHMPIYADQDVVITQSLPMMIYLAEKYDMAGNGPAERIQVLEILSQCHDALFHWCGLLPSIVRISIDEETVNKRLAAFMGKGQWGLASNGFHQNMKGLDNYLNRNASDSGYMVGDELSFADLHAFNVLCNWYKAFNREEFSKYTQLDQYIHRIAKHPKIAEYIATTKGSTTWLPLPKAATNLTSPADLEGLII